LEELKTPGDWHYALVALGALAGMVVLGMDLCAGAGAQAGNWPCNVALILVAMLFDECGLWSEPKKIIRDYQCGLRGDIG